MGKMDPVVAAAIENLDENQLRQVVRDFAEAMPSLASNRIAQVMNAVVPPTEKYVPRNGEVPE